MLSLTGQVSATFVVVSASLAVPALELPSNEDDAKKKAAKQFFRLPNHDHVRCEPSLRSWAYCGREILGTFVTRQSTLYPLEQSVLLAFSSLSSNATLARPSCFDSRILSRLCSCLHACLPSPLPCGNLMRKVCHNPHAQPGFPNSQNTPNRPSLQVNGTVRRPVSHNKSCCEFAQGSVREYQPETGCISHSTMGFLQQKQSIPQKVFTDRVIDLLDPKSWLPGS